MTPTKKQVATGVLAVTSVVATGGPAAVAATQQRAAHRAEVSAARAASRAGARTASRAGMQPQARLQQVFNLCAPYLTLPMYNPPKQCAVCIGNVGDTGITLPFLWSF